MLPLAPAPRIPPVTMSEAVVNITVNGDPYSGSAATVGALLEALSLQGKRLAVELNRNIVPRDAYGQTALASGDVVEIVQFVGGG